jgi:hypothetical protein
MAITEDPTVCIFPVGCEELETGLMFRPIRCEPWVILGRLAQITRGRGFLVQSLGAPVVAAEGSER